jgi:carboxylesterase type B
MVYMHSGGYAGGSGNDLLSYDGENLARHHDVVVVTHNHRLDLFGYLNLAEAGGERYASSGNVGMLAIVAILEWVRDNIANFGGDPGNVLIYGQSGGGGKLGTLMAMPSAKGLFHRAVVRSGSGLRSGSAESAATFGPAMSSGAAISAAGQRQNAIRRAERKAAQDAAPVYMYLYAWRTPALGGMIGTFHSSEIAFVFDNATLCTNDSGGTPAALALSDRR